MAFNYSRPDEKIYIVVIRVRATGHWLVQPYKYKADAEKFADKFRVSGYEVLISENNHGTPV